MTAIRILVVDDQPLVREAVRRLLTANDMDVHLHGDPSSAVGKALLVEPDVILLDVQMTPIDGLDVLLLVRAQAVLADVPIVMLSGVESPQIKAEAFRRGANDYVMKLPGALELNARVRYHARAFRTGREREAAYEALLRSRAEMEQRNRQIEQMNRELAESALTDTLTGLRNRRFLKLFLDQAAADSHRSDDERRRASSGPVVIFLLDLDHFKLINDRLGHDAGDAALVEVGRRLRETVREEDAVLRWGGEEFLVIARYPDMDEALRTAQRLLGAIADQPMQLNAHTQATVTMSVGFAPFPWGEEGDGAASIEFSLRLADAACYLAKANGRNRACGVLAGPDTAQSLHAIANSVTAAFLREADGRALQLVELPGPIVPP